MPDRNVIKIIVLDLLKELCPDQDFSKIDETTNVVRALGLVTDDGLDLACMLSRKLGCEVPDYVNPLFNDTKKGKQGFERTIGDIIDLACELTEMENKNAKAN